MSRLIRMEKVEGLVGGIVFGPVRSRRFGRSLGINPLPSNRKLCTFDCVYCECGPTSQDESHRLDVQPFPPTAKIIESVRRAMEMLRRTNASVDSLTLTGNGETTLHPAFEKIVRGLVALRDSILPKAQIVVLTNGTRLGHPSIRRALRRVDQCVVKIDAGRESMFQLLNRPLERASLEDLTEAASDLSGVLAKNHGQDARATIVVQTLFVRGRVDNTQDNEIAEWIERVARTRPQRVQIYSLDRPPAVSGLLAVPRTDLKRIAALLAERTHLPVNIY